MAKYIIDIPDEVPVSDELVPSDMCRPSWYLEAYEKGKADAETEVWDFMKAIINLDVHERIKLFGIHDLWVITKEHSYQEAKAKYEAWKAEREQIRVGDEVTSKFGDGVVIDIVADESVHILGKDGHWNEYAEGEYRKTGRHFNEVAELLKKMRDTE